MLAFECDYNKGAHEKIMQKLVETNFEACPGYGEDIYCEKAKEKIRKACECPHADIHFLVGGTQTNTVVIDALLDSYEGVVSASSGHVNAHEAGAIEYTGHKVMTVPGHNGKMDAGELEQFLNDFWTDSAKDHMVFPGMVYISYPTEYGTIYSKEEISNISKVCKKYQIPLYLDGARLGYGLMSKEADMTLKDIAELCDVFYIGGTKVGALFGEAVVFTKENTPKHFFTRIKQHGALLAKGRLLGIQFDTLFTDNLYFEISKNAIDRAEEMKAGIKEKGYLFHLDSPTNQQFVVLSLEQIERLKKHVRFEIWEKKDEEHMVVRFATSWATSKSEIEQLLDLL